MELIQWVITSPFICLGWIIVGAVAGALARQIMKSGNYPFFMDLILGIAGAVVGGWLVGILGFAKVVPDGSLTLVIFNLAVATAGACVLIFIGRTIRGGGSKKARN
ncbi:MAG: GlsB/YeaQ/YmgE family stress response membrane protein [Aggregatilineales bacterium]